MLTSAMRSGAVVVLLVACNGRGDTADEGPRMVRGVAVQRNVTERGVVDQPRDLSTVTFQSHPSSTARAGNPDGSFEVPIGGSGSEWLELNVGGERVFLPGGSRPPDVSVYHFGRGDVQFPVARTSVAFAISGLAAWRTGDSLQIVSPNVGLAMAGPETELPVAPSVGSTTISGQALDWKTAFAPVIDAGKGDTTWVIQMAGATSATGSHYTTLARAGIAAGFTVSDGRPATLAAALAPVAQDRKLALHWRGSEFAALAAQAGPGAQPAAAPALSIRALPEPLARSNEFFTSYHAGLPSLVEFGPIPGSADFDQSIEYGDPFSSGGASWTEFVTMVYAAPVPVPTAQGTGSLSAMMVAAIPVAALAGSGAIAPSISPVRNVKVDGRSLDVPAAGVGLSPTVTWDAPAIAPESAPESGTSTSYRVTVHAVEASRDGVSLKKLATLHTRLPSLKLPESVMTAGSSYVLTITAISASGADLAAAPFAGSLPYAAADHVTAQLTP